MNRFLFIGLNYTHIETRQVDCITNIYKFTEYASTRYNINIDPYDIITDSKDKDIASMQGILKRLYEIGLETWNKNIENVFIYFTGDSIDIIDYIGGYNIKQGIVPSDYNIHGTIDKKDLCKILMQYNPNSRIIFIADCCFTTENIFDLKYIWDVKNDAFNILDTPYMFPNRKILVLSYCIDKHSVRVDDNFFHVLNMNEKIYSYADYIAKLEDKNYSIFELLQDIYNIFKIKNINMKPVMCSTYLPANDDKIFKYLIQNDIQSSFEEYKRKSYTQINDAHQTHQTQYIQQKPTYYINNIPYVQVKYNEMCLC